MAQEVDIIALCEVPTYVVNLQYPCYQQIEYIDNRYGKPDIALWVNRKLCNEKFFFRSDKNSCFIRIESIKVNLGILHLSSLLYPSQAESQNAEIALLLQSVERIEKRYNDKRTVLLGDFNIGLFDQRMFDISQFNAKLFQYQMSRENRKNGLMERDTFYNPMLLVYRDTMRDDLPRGTYYYSGVSPQWHCFDHLLMKQQLVNSFIPNSLCVLSRLGADNLIKNNKPINTISDHLPIQFEMKRGTFDEQQVSMGHFAD